MLRSRHFTKELVYDGKCPVTEAERFVVPYGKNLHLFKTKGQLALEVGQTVECVLTAAGNIYDVKQGEELLHSSLPMFEEPKQIDAA